MRPRISPITVVGVLVIAGLSFGWWRSFRQHQQRIARQELLIKEWLEPIDIKDATQVYYRKLPPRYVGCNQWRIYLPPGRRYLLCAAYFDPLAPSPEPRAGLLEQVLMEAGQSLLEVEWRRDVELKPQLFLSMLPPGGEQTLKYKAIFPEQFSLRFAQCEPSTVTYLGGDTATVSAPAERLDLTLVRMRVSSENTPPPENSPDACGLLVWIATYEGMEGKTPPIPRVIAPPAG